MLQQIFNSPIALFGASARQDRPSNHHCFFGADDAQSLPRLLRKPYRHFVEMEDYEAATDTLEFIRNEFPHCSLSVSTKTAFEKPLAELFTGLLSRQQNMSVVLMNDIRTCVQEAVMNSIIHGNLQLTPSTREACNFQQHLEEITESIKHHANNQKRISLYAWFTPQHITICVADEGMGFDIMQSEGDPESPYGRGLSLIRHMSSNIWQPSCNHLHMQFKTHG